MKLIGAGLPRTATLSQRAALELLGLTPCHHMQHVFANMPDVHRWREVLDGKRSAAELLDGFEAVVDWPGSFYYRELMDAYPEAKVLLSVRDGDAWARSMRQTIWGLFYDDSLMRHISYARTKVDHDWDVYIKMMLEMWWRADLFQGAETTVGELSAAMERYNDAVKRTVPAQRLLVWKPADGWEPLCAFLDLPAPSVPLPYVNDTDAFIDGIISASLASLNAHLAVSA